MGHIHQFQVLSEEPLIAHVGSMERTDFGESKQPKLFAFMDTINGKLTHEFVPLSVKSLYDLVIDKSNEDPTSLMASIKQWIRDYGSKNKMLDSIVRVDVIVGEAAAHVVDTGEILRFLIHDMAVSNCVGVHATVLSKRQLRDATITEKADPKAALEKWLELNIADAAMRDDMRKAGFRIIEGGGNG
jgi:exonuclease SbcD